MTEEQKLEKRFEKWLRKYLLCNDCKKKCSYVQFNAYCEEQVKQAYLAGADFGYKKGYHDAGKHYMNVIDSQHKLVDESKKELEQKLEQTEKDLADYQFNYPTIKELEKENADLKKRLAFARAEFQRQYKENTELRDNYDQFKASAIPEIERLQKEHTELKDELVKWKDEWQEQVQKAIDEGYARTLQTIQLTKAKELLKEAQGYIENEDDELYDEIEQFLKEIEK